MFTANEVWLDALATVLEERVNASPRGLQTREVLNYHLGPVNPYTRVVTVKKRDLNYRFMAAEFCWIAAGCTAVKQLTWVNSEMGKFSDDGKVLAGSYGAPWLSQVEYVIRKLTEDPDTRQAILTIWKPNPQPSKDIPCTVAFQFLIRNHELNMIATMRSSDVWLGLPYDMFNFMSLQVIVATALGIKTGPFWMNLGSLHVYEDKVTLAGNILYNSQDPFGFEADDPEMWPCPILPAPALTVCPKYFTPPEFVMMALNQFIAEEIKDYPFSFYSGWEHLCRTILAKNRREGREVFLGV